MSLNWSLSIPVLVDQSIDLHVVIYDYEATFTVTKTETHDEIFLRVPGFVVQRSVGTIARSFCAPNLKREQEMVFLVSAALRGPRPGEPLNLCRRPRDFSDEESIFCISLTDLDLATKVHDATSIITYVTNVMSPLGTEFGIKTFKIDLIEPEL